jgi:RimJ/RimL family protein N-acetyltransferase
MRELSPDGRRELVPLFARHETLRAVVDSVLEGRLGRAWISSTAPGSARLSLGCYEIFGGAADPAAARELTVEIEAPRELVFGNDPAWKRRLLEIFGARLTDRPMRSFASRAPDESGSLEPEPPPAAGVAPVRMDARLAAELDRDLAPHAMQVFESVRDFEERGAGYAIVRNGEIASAATTYAVSERAVEVAISTRPAYRGRGLAFLAASALLRHAASRSLTACWNASNPVSQRLAVRLGLFPDGVCQVLYLA